MACPICFESYTDERGRHLPKALPCLHTLCSVCLPDLEFGNGFITCPICRQRVKSADVKINFAVVEMLSTSSRAQALLAAPVQQPMAPSAPRVPEPWKVGPQNMYAPDAAPHLAAQAFHFAAPAGHVHDENAAWLEERRATLKEWGRKRERTMHRAPQCLMDQMVSGSSFYPIRLLDDDWLTPRETAMVQQLETVLAPTSHAPLMARDMLAPLIYGIDVRIVLDNSGSMTLDMLGNSVSSRFASFDIEGENRFDRAVVQNALQAALPPGWFSRSATQQNVQSAVGSPNPFKPRWWFARDAMRHWMKVYSILGIDPWVYFLNPSQGLGMKCKGSQMEQAFANSPGGTTAMTEAIQSALADHQRERPSDPLLIITITDGEANNMLTFNKVLDEIQNLVYGDVQCCLMGLSLIKQDIEWFENEECDETRIRTVEAFEVENRQIQLREVIKREGGYNFDMHTQRVLLTNYFPADYDYEAPMQNLRHRLYITIHGRDRWWGLYNPCWRLVVSNICCSVCFVATGCHCCGWCQGNECGKWQLPDGLAD